MTRSVRIRARAAGVLGAVTAVIISTVGTPSVMTASATVAYTFYAAPTGSGTDCSLAAPCSLTGARDKVRTVTAGMTGDIVVNLRGGTYSITSPLTLTASDSGLNDHSVIWQAYGSEKPVLSGGTSLSGGWILIDAAKNIYRKTGVTSVFRDLSVGTSASTVPAIRARQPNLTSNANLGAFQRVVDVDPTSATYRVAVNEVAAWNNLQNVEMVDLPHWYHNRLRVASYTTDSTYAYVTFQSPESGVAFAKGASFYQNSAYYWENAYEFLDAPGEWYLDDPADNLYYIPRAGEDMATASVVAGVTPTLLNFAGTAAAPVENVQVRGLEFTHTGWDGPSSSGLVASQAVRPVYGSAIPEAVHVQYAQNIRFNGNTFQQLASEAISFTVGVKNSRIVGNTFAAIGANAVVLDERGVKNPSATDQTESVLVANNTFAGMGKTYDNGDAIVAYFVKDTVIEHNTISDTSYTAIQVGGQTGGNVDAGMSSNIIRFNDIHDFMQVHDDGGGAYTLGRQPGTQVFQNWIHGFARSPWASTYPIAGAYLDNYSEYITVECNAIDDVGTGATATKEQLGVGAQNNTWILNCDNQQAVRDNAGVRPDYVEPQ